MMRLQEILGLWTLVVTYHTCLAQNVVLVGSHVSSYATYKEPLDGARKVFLVDQKFEKNGRLFAFIGYFKNTKPVELQVWRPVNGYNYQLKYSFSFTPTSADLNKRKEILTSTCFQVRPNDRLALMNREDQGPVAHIFVDKGLNVLFYTVLGDANDRPTYPAIDQIVTFDGLDLPYNFALDAAYDTDTTERTPCSQLGLPPEPTTTTTVMPPTTTPDLRGPPGPKGDKGDLGNQGPPGAKGEQGPKGDQGNQGLRGKAGPKGDMGPRGPMGQTGPIGPAGPQGPIGTKGDKGDNGPRGQKGERGPPGSAGGSGNAGGTAGASGQNKCKCGTGLLHPNLILGLIVWLLILTLLVIMLLVLMTRRKQQETKRDSFRTLQREGNWIDGTMKEDTWKDYSIETVSNHGHH